MLSTRTALATLRPSLRPARYTSRCYPSRRTFISPAIHSLSEGFLDLATALPYPPDWAPYSCTIILVTVVTRLAFTVPFSIWAKNRQWRAETVVIPQLKTEMPAIHKQVQQDMKQTGFRGDKKAVIAEVNKRTQPIATKRRKELLAQHNASPMLTILLPAVSQLPLFVGTSWVLSAASAAPTVLDSEAFLTLTSLAHADSTATLPILLGIITLANVESSRWFASAEALQREQQVTKWTAERRARGEQVLEPGKISQSALRLLSVGRILIAAMVPGSVQLYWVTSATFGLFQSWALDYWDMRRRKRVAPPTATGPKATRSA
ncbi:60Kd inner membrane protein-domain-containing protein [Ganoderma leucocontextum]|nr:60Kd inner membrane protein-domain-containing protein [Ganoderma leucocontextum]